MPGDRLRFGDVGGTSGGGAGTIVGLIELVFQLILLAIALYVGWVVISSLIAIGF